MEDQYGIVIPKHIQVKKHIRDDNDGFVEAIPGIVFAVIISYVYLNVGSFMNGALGSELVDTFPTNIQSGSVDYTYWHNATTSSYRNITLPCFASELTSTTTKFYILANGSAIFYNLTTNGNPTNRSSQLAQTWGWNQTLATLITNSNVSNSDTYLNFTWNVSGLGNRIYIRVYGTYYNSGDYRSTLQNNTVDTLGNLSGYFDDNVAIIKIAITIAVLLVPIAAVMTLRRFT